MKKHNVLLVVFLLIFFNSCSQEKTKSQKVVKSVVDKPNLVFKDLVPDNETAIKIAETILVPIYGKKIYEQRPFVARLKSPNVWAVEGTLHTTKGGVAYIEIQKKDCKILKVYHEK
ncbi:YbbC/YhhH family protein [Flavobacterium sp. 22076]|uniref:YbbC/YhhH family protein n=1 Tax=unclassified Flavobacterium TaxID=196869 RepID=UPI003F87E900